MPVLSAGKDKMLDGEAIYAFLKNSGPKLIVIEKVHAMPGQGVSSMFTFGVSFGTVVGIATCCNARLLLVAPAAWKKKFNLIGKDKDAARKEAYMRFPSLRSELTRKKDVGRADALLLAEYGRLYAE